MSSVPKSDQNSDHHSEQTKETASKENSAAPQDSKKDATDKDKSYSFTDWASI